MNIGIFSFSLKTVGDKQEIKITIPSNKEDLPDIDTQGRQAYEQLASFTIGWTLGLLNSFGFSAVENAVGLVADSLMLAIEEAKEKPSENSN